MSGCHGDGVDFGLWVLWGFKDPMRPKSHWTILEGVVECMDVYVTKLTLVRLSTAHDIRHHLKRESYKCMKSYGFNF